MRIAILLFCLVANCTTAFCQQAKQVNIPGTRVFISPPPGFTIASNFAGLQKDENTAIQVMDFAGGDFYKNAATFSKEKFESKGVKVLAYKEMAVNGYAAKYASLQANAAVKTHQVVFGDTTFSTMLVAIIPAGDSVVEQQMVGAILSARYDKNFKPNPLAAASFTLDTKKSKLKFAQMVANIFLYTLSGKENSDEPGLMVIPMPANPLLTPEFLASSMVDGFKKKGFTDIEIKNKSVEKVNGYNAYEAEVYAKNDGKQAMVYQLVVISGDKAIVMQGLAKSDFEASLKEFKALSKTIKFK
jgi:hypothetical protein